MGNTGKDRSRARLAQKRRRARHQRVQDVLARVAAKKNAASAAPAAAPKK